MGKLLNFIIGILIILFFVGCGWTLLKSSDFVNAGIQKAQNTGTTLTKKAGDVGNDLLEGAEKTVDKVAEVATETIRGKEEAPQEEGKSSDLTEESTSAEEQEDRYEGAKTEETPAGDTPVAAVEKPAATPQSYETTTTLKKSAEASTTAPTSTASSAPFLVIAGSFTQAINAETEIARIKKLGYSQAELRYLGSTKYLSLIAERVNSRKAANGIVAKLKEQGIEAYVHTRRSGK